MSTDLNYDLVDVLKRSLMTTRSPQAIEPSALWMVAERVTKGTIVTMAELCQRIQIDAPVSRRMRERQRHQVPKMAIFNCPTASSPPGSAFEQAVLYTYDTTHSFRNPDKNNTRTAPTVPALRTSLPPQHFSESGRVSFTNSPTRHYNPTALQFPGIMARTGEEENSNVGRNPMGSALTSRLAISPLSQPSQRSTLSPLSPSMSSSPCLQISHPQLTVGCSTVYAQIADEILCEGRKDSDARWAAIYGPMSAQPFQSFPWYDPKWDTGAGASSAPVSPCGGILSPGILTAPTHLWSATSHNGIQHSSSRQTQHERKENIPPSLPFPVSPNINQGTRHKGTRSQGQFESQAEDGDGPLKMPRAEDYRGRELY